MNPKESILLIGGDVYPSGNCEKVLTGTHPEQVFHDLIEEFEKSDYLVANLETPLTNQNSPIEKDGANLSALPQTMNGIKSAGFSAFNLANNHILDHGEQGLTDTLHTLNKFDIPYFGAGKNIDEASKPHVVEINGVKIGFLGFAEHEFSIAHSNKAGASPLNIPDNIRAIRSLKKNVDHIIIFYHGGKEHYPYPTPNQQNISRFFIEEGADAVIAQHSHIVGGLEEYKGKLIMYGQGNFLFEKQSRNYKSWFEGVLIKLMLTKESIRYELIPFEQSNGFIGVRKMQAEKKIELLERINTYTSRISNPAFVKEEWQKLCRAEYQLYQSRLFGHNKYLRFLNRKINFAHWLYPKWKKTMIRNVVECETHREGLETLWMDNHNKI